MRIVAHRGYSARWPENSPSAAVAAIDAGADLVEMDARLTKDEHVFSCHDSNMLRAFGVDMVVESSSSTELEEISHGGQSPTSIANLLAAVDRRAGVLIDVKVPGGAILSALSELCGSSVWPDEVWLGVRSVAQAQRAAEIFGGAVRILGMPASAPEATEFLTVRVGAIRIWQAEIDRPWSVVLVERTQVWVTTGGLDGAAVGDTDDAGLAAIGRFGASAVLVNDPLRAKRCAAEGGF